MRLRNRYKNLIFGVGAFSTLLFPGSAAAQQVTFRLPDGDPNTNSDVIRSVAFSPDGSLVAVGYGRFLGLLQQPRPGQAVLWKSRSGTRKATIAAREDGVCSVAFSPDGKTIAIGEYAGFIQLWDVSTGQERLTIRTPALIRGQIAFSPDGKFLAAGLWTGKAEPGPGNDVMLWDPATGKPTLSLEGHNNAADSVAFSPNGKMLASGGSDGVIKLWEIGGARLRATLEFPRLRKQLGSNWPISVASIVFSSDGRTLVASAGVPVAVQKLDGVGEVTFWNTANAQEVGVQRGYGGMVWQVALSPDAKVLATAASDGLVRLWDANTRRKVAEMKGGGPIAFSPDGKELLLSADERTLAVRKVADAIGH
jgi:WD40 repeat protein